MLRPPPKTDDKQSLVDQLVGQVGRPRRAVALAVAGLLAIVILAALFIPGGRAPGGSAWGLWKLGLEPSVIVYILWMYPPLHRRWTRAIDALRPLADRSELVEQAFTVDRRREWAALALGVAFSIWVTRPWQYDGRWLLLYFYASSAIMFSLMALAIFDCLVRTRRLARIVRAGVQLDLFDRGAFTPLARWGQSVSLIFVGGTCLSLVFQTYESLATLQSLVIYSIMVVVSLTLFFISIWSIHDALVAAQRRELAVVRAHWSKARSELKLKLAQGEADEVASLYAPIAAVSEYENRVLAASTWPFNPKIVKELVASLVAPILIYGVKIALGLARDT